jgi:ureidoacrylate peracid hydrolase
MTHVIRYLSLEVTPMNDVTRDPSIDTDVSIAVRIDARPEPFDLHLAQTAIVVVDLQNGYASPGGYRELVGQDVSAARQVINNTLRLLHAARAAALTVILLKNGWDAELKSAGGPRSPNWHKSNPLKTMRARPELKRKILTHGSWDYEFVDDLKPAPSDIVVPKTRYSGFCGTELDNILRAREIRNLIFAGIASNVCVESTIRDAYHREFFCLLVRDATLQSGPPFIQEATIYNVERYLGWVTSTDTVCAAIMPK